MSQQVHADLPVCVALTGRLGAEVAAFAESEAGWQVVDADGPLVPAFTVSDRLGDGPTVVVVPATPEASQLRDTMLAGALDVVVWPVERERLLAAPSRLPRSGESHGTTPLLTVAGTRGGVGVSTVALTIAGTIAWAGGRALCVGGPGMVRLAGLVPWQGPGLEEVVALGRHAAHELPALARDVPGVPGLAVLGGHGHVPDASTWPYDLVVQDAGAAAGGGAGAAHVVVAAADGTVATAPTVATVPAMAAAPTVAAASGPAVVLVVEHGPLNRAAVTAKLGGPPAAWLPYSNRVARAGAAGRVPSALPGSWVAAVQQGLSGAAR